MQNKPLTPAEKQPENAGNVVDQNIVDQQIVAQHRWLRTVIASRIGNVSAVDDLLQEVIMAAVAQQNQWSEINNFQAWLYRIAVRQTLLYRRQLGREKRRIGQISQQQLSQQQFSQQQVTNGQINQSASPLNWLLNNERQQSVRQAIQQLRPQDREILLLKYTENWSCRDLANHLGTQITTIETRLQRARNRLRKELARHDITE